MSESQSPHLMRRLAAILYDSLLLFAVWFIAGLPLPLIPDSLQQQPLIRYGIFLYVLLVTFLFFGWFWTHGGQTLGMRAWKIRVVPESGNGTVSWLRAWRRFCWSIMSWLCFGLGFIWSLLDPDRRTWHDKLSGTKLVRIVASGSLEPQNADADQHEQQGG